MRASEDTGFGRPTEGQTTTMGNPYARFTTIPRDGGFDVIVGAKGDAKTEAGDSTVTIHFRDDHGPRIGERVMVGKRLAKVADRRYDQAGRLQLLDEDTRIWEPWDGGR